MLSTQEKFVKGNLEHKTVKEVCQNIADLSIVNR